MHHRQSMWLLRAYQLRTQLELEKNPWQKKDPGAFASRALGLLFFVKNSLLRYTTTGARGLEGLRTTTVTLRSCQWNVCQSSSILACVEPWRSSVATGTPLMLVLSCWVHMSSRPLSIGVTNFV